MIKSLHIMLLEIKLFLKDRAGLAFGLLLPIAIFALNYGAFGGQVQFYGTAYIVNQDQGGAYSDILLERLNEVETMDVKEISAAEAERKLDRSDILIALFIPAGFSDAIETGQPRQLEFRQRGNGGQEGQIVAGIVRSVTDGINQELEAIAQVQSAVASYGITLEEIEITVTQLLQEPAVSVSKNVMGSSPNAVNQFLPGIVTMFILFAISMNARALLEERKRGTLERLLTTQLSVGQMFNGKFMANVARGFIQALILFSLAYTVFQMFTPGSFFLALFATLIFTGAASAIGIIIGSVSRSEGQAIWMSVFITMAIVMLGGTFFPISEGTVIHTLSKFSINTYINDALRTIIIDNGSLADVWPEMVIIAGVAVVGLVISRYLFKVISQ